MAPRKADPNNKLVAENRRARYEYKIGDTLEAGVMLLGTEVKALREGKINIAESYASIENGELWLINANIPEYSGGNRENHQPKRPRKLLVKRKELAKLALATERKGFTLAPLKLYFNDRGLAKLLIGVAEGKKLADKRETEKKRDWQRQKARLMREQG